MTGDKIIICEKTTCETWSSESFTSMYLCVCAFVDVKESLITILKFVSNSKFEYEINNLINQVIDRKKDACMKPIIEAMSNSLVSSKSTSSGSAEQAEQTSAQNEPSSSTAATSASQNVLASGQEVKSVLSQQTTSTVTITPQKQKITVEDFLLMGGEASSSKVATITTTPSAAKSTLEKSKSNTDLDKQQLAVSKSVSKDLGNAKKGRI
jgi:hypothetical protein